MIDNHTIANTLKTWNKMTMTYVLDKRYPEAIDLLEKTLEVEEELKITREAGQTLINIANVYFCMGKYDLSLKALSSAESRFNVAKDGNVIFNIHNMMGTILYQLKHYTTALVHYKKCLQLAIDQDKQAKCKYQMACAYHKLQNYGVAIECVKTALLMFAKLNNTDGQKDSEVLLRQIQKARSTRTMTL